VVPFVYSVTNLGKDFQKSDLLGWLARALRVRESNQEIHVRATRGVNKYATELMQPSTKGLSQNKCCNCTRRRSAPTRTENRHSRGGVYPRPQWNGRNGRG
jgi:hypothetical protein